MNPEPPASLRARFERACAEETNIHEHLPVMREYARDCARVTEMGVGTGQSTLAWLAAQPETLVCYDISPGCIPVIEALRPHRGRTEITFHLSDSRRVWLEATDLLFIDTGHSFNHLTIELALHTPAVRRFVLLHDTTSFALRGDDNLTPGLWAAVEDFCARHRRTWRLRERRENNNGLTVLERVSGSL